MPSYSARPHHRDELIRLIKERIETHGKHCNLNDIDVSGIEDFSFVFKEVDFQGDISQWDVSNAKKWYLCLQVLRSAVIFLSGMSPRSKAWWGCSAILSSMAIYRIGMSPKFKE